MSKTTQSQKEFFANLGKLHPEKLNDEVASILSLSKSGAYSKMNGTNSLSFDEAVKLCKHFNILLDRQIHSEKLNALPFPFYSDALRSKPANFSDYLKNILNHISLEKAGAKPSAVYVANEIPIFHIIQFPYLCAFKFFVWNKINWQISTGYQEQIIQDLVTNKEIHEYRAALIQNYNGYSGSEIWNLHMLRQTYSQISYFIDIGIITNKELVDNILFDIHKLIIHLSKMAESGVKRMFGENKTGSKCKIYLNELIITNDIIFIQTEKLDVVYFHYDVPNYIRTTEELISNHMKLFVEQIKLVSSPISDAILIKERAHFFHQLEKDHEFQKSRILGRLT